MVQLSPHKAHPGSEVRCQGVPNRPWIVTLSVLHRGQNVAGWVVALFSGSCAWAEKKSLVHTVYACSVPLGFLGIWKFP